MAKGPSKGYKQSKEHIRNRVVNRTSWNGGHNRLTTEMFLQKLQQRWPECPYGKQKIQYIKNNLRIILICQIHGDFLKWPSDVLNRSGCPKCKGQGFSRTHYLQELTERFPEYDFSKSSYTNATTLLEIGCRRHGLFTATRNGLLNNNKRCPECTKEKVLETRINAGSARDPALLSDFERYKKAVWKETNKSYRTYKNVLGERNRSRHLDHVYSILHGFRDNIPPIVLGNIVNLRIIDSKLNQSKNTKSDCTKEELMKLYEGKNK